jgi:hypothetical protein
VQWTSLGWRPNEKQDEASECKKTTGEVLVASFCILFYGFGYFELSIAVYLFQKFCGVCLLYRSLE